MHFMHEFYMTSQIVKSVLEEAEKRGAKKVLEVHLVIGNLTLLGIEQIRFNYKILAEDTKLKGSRLLIKRKEGKVGCDKCGYEGALKFKNDPIYHISFPTLTCPKCASSVRILEGKECLIKSIKMAI
jgi:hydrogenase nickel incorporation protein HypA/HybF